MIHHGDCLEVMAAMEPESVSAIVTDPPYDLTSTGARNGSPRNPGTGPYSRGFMGKAWDGTGIAFRAETWEAAYRVAQPSAYLLAFGGTRTVHRMAVAIEDAGWIIRDMLVWAYASGFPKSKASLKPAWEPIVMARKPGPLRMLAIDECRIPSNDGFEDAWDKPISTSTANVVLGGLAGPGRKRVDISANKPVGGRWPANVILTDPIFDGGVPGVVGGGFQSSTAVPGAWQPRGAFPIDNPEPTIYGDSGTYSRFFLIPKADRGDREPVLGGLPERDDPFAGTGYTVWCEACGKQRVNVPGAACSCAEPKWSRKAQRTRANVHPTVKPTDLMRHLVRLVTPPGGTVLDPFLGSGTTGIACDLEGFPWIGIEKEAEYVAIAEARLNGTQRGMGLSA